jgi:arabinofuranosyltransferase
MNSHKRTLLAASAVAYLIFILLFWDYSIDDAFVTFRYAENLSDGGGLVFNPGDKPVEGYSNFLWLLILSVAYSLGLPTYMMAKVLGIIFFLLTGAVWFLYFEKSPSKYMWLTGPFFLVTPITAFWAVSGLELGLYSLLVAGLALSIFRQSYWSLLFGSLMVLIRPEGIIIGLVLVVTDWLAGGRSVWRQRSKFCMFNIMALALTMILLIVFRLIVFGHPMPNTFYAKSTFSTYSLLDMVKMSAYFLPVTVLFLSGIYRVTRMSGYDSRIVVLAAALVCMAAINCTAHPVMNINLRYLAAFLPFFFAVSLYALDSIGRKRVTGALLILSILSLLIPTGQVSSTVKLERKIIEAQKELIKFVNGKPGRTTISLTDIGRVPYYTDATYYDLWGLTSEDIAHTYFNPLREFHRFPDYFVLVGFLGKDRPMIRFLNDRSITKNRGFDRAYDFVGAAVPQGANLFDEGYYYLIYEKNQAVVDSILSVSQRR